MNERMNQSERMDNWLGEWMDGGRDVDQQQPREFSFSGDLLIHIKYVNLETHLYIDPCYV